MSERDGSTEGKRVEESPPRGRKWSGSQTNKSCAEATSGISGRRRKHPYEIRRRAVQLHLEEGISLACIGPELGIPATTIYEWIRRYQQYGEEGLKDHPACGGSSRLPKPVGEKIRALKRENPQHGVKRISQVLRRLFFLKASPETVRRHLKKAGLGTAKGKSRKKPHPPERRFEASTPNQMWQSDITYYPILGKMAYIIGFIDDHSRYITALGVYRSQTAEHVLETYRMAVGEFGVPREMLTDNGRQYANWRGKTKFQRELDKDHVHHIRSSPHHPMTLGKIERFWQTLKEEFLSRARFETFEEARERLAYWVKHYNHKRTHQSLDGLTPADRFFSIQKDLRATIERGVAANVEEMALRGQPLEPFYLVGRMGDQSVVIETDKKRVSLRVDGQAVKVGETMVYELKERVNHETGTGDNGPDSPGGRGGAAQAADADLQREGKEPGRTGPVERAAQRLPADEGAGRAVGHHQHVGETGADGDAHGAGSDVEATRGGAVKAARPGGATHGTNPGPEAGGRTGGDELSEREANHEGDGTGSIRGGGEMPGDTGGVDGTAEGVHVVPGTGGQRVAVLPVAGSGGFGYAGGAGTAGNEGRGQRTGPAAAGQAAAGPQGAGAGTGQPGPQRDLAWPVRQEPAGGGIPLESGGDRLMEVISVDGRNRPENGRESAGDAGTPGGPTHGHAGGAGPGGQPQDVLRVAGSGQGGDAPGVDGPAGRAAAEAGGSGEGPAPRTGGHPGEGAAGVGEPAAYPEGVPGDVGRVGRGDVA